MVQPPPPLLVAAPLVEELFFSCGFPYPYLLYSSKVEVEDTVEYLDEVLLVHVGEDGDGHRLQVRRDLVLAGQPEFSFDGYQSDQEVFFNTITKVLDGISGITKYIFFPFGGL